MKQYAPIRHQIAIFVILFFSITSFTFLNHFSDIPISGNYLCPGLISVFFLWIWTFSGGKIYDRATLLISLGIIASIYQVLDSFLAPLLLKESLNNSAYYVGLFLVILISLYPVSRLTHRYLSSLIDRLWVDNLTHFNNFAFFPSVSYLLKSECLLGNEKIHQKALKKLSRIKFATTIKILAETIISHPDEKIRQQAYQLLSTFNDKNSVNSICEIWFTDRNQMLESMIQEKKWISASPLNVSIYTTLLNWNKRYYAKLNDNWLEPITEARLDDNEIIASNAEKVLTNLSDKSLQNHLCVIAIKNKDSWLVEKCHECGYLPEDTVLQAAFLFLNREYEKYEALDYDFSLMQRFYHQDDNEGQQKIREIIRQIGRQDYLKILSDPEDSTQQYSIGESQVLIQTLSTYKDWESIWKLIFEIPLVESARALNLLQKQNWLPETEYEKQLFEKLVQLSGDVVEITTEDYKNAIPLAKLKAKARVPGRINDVSFSPDQPVIALGTGSRTVVMWNYQEGKRENVIRGFEHSIGNVTFLRSGSLIAAERSNTQVDCNIYVYENYKISEGFILGNHDGYISDMIPYGANQLISAGRDSGYIIWSIPERKAIHKETHHTWARDICISDDETQLLYLHNNIELVSLQNYKLIGRRKSSSVIRAAAFSPDGNLAFTGTFNGNIDTYQLNDIRRHQITRNTNPLSNHVCYGPCVGLEVLSRYNILICIDSVGELSFYSLGDYQFLGNIHVPNGDVTSIHISPDQSFMVIGSASSTLTFWDLRSLQISYEQPFSRMHIDTLPFIQTLIEDPEIDPKFRKGLEYMQIIFNHQFQYAIEIDNAPTIAIGEFDIEIE